MHWLRLVSLRVQIIVLVSAFTLAVGVGNTLRTRLALDSLAQEQFERRGLATANALAAQSSDALLTGDLFGLYELLSSALEADPDLRYALIVGPAGEVRAHTFGPGVPRGLVEANQLSAGQSFSVRRLRTDEGPVMDVAVPMPGLQDTFRLGMSEQAITAVVTRHTLYLLAMTAISLLPVLVLTYLLGGALTRPLLALVELLGTLIFVAIAGLIKAAAEREEVAPAERAPGQVQGEPASTGPSRM